MRGLLWIPAILAVVLVWAALDDASGIRKSWSLRSDLHAAQARIRDLRTEVAALRHEAELLQSDSFAIERAIREELGFAREGETLLRWSGSGPISERIP